MATQTPPPSGLSIVEAGQEHARSIASLALQAGMGELSNRGVSFVAVEDHPEAPDCDKSVLGFVRVVRSAGHDYVCPIVVDDQARGRGVGLALMELAHERFGTLRFVARGSAVPFYESLGCRETSWADIASDISSDCLDCPDKAGCAPQPMIWD